MKKLKILCLTLIISIFSYILLPSVSNADPITTTAPSSASSTTTTTTAPSSTTQSTTTTPTAPSSGSTTHTTTTITGHGTTNTTSGGNAGIDPFNYDPNNSGEIDSDAVAKHVGPIFNILYAISIIVSVITLSIVGLKFIGASAQEKAEYKQHLVPIATGILIISFLITIISTLAKFAGLF